jgi:hypothetical protein
LKIHNQSGSGNLRILKQGIWDFERVAICFTDKHWKSPDAVDAILSVILALSYEIKTGQIVQGQLQELQSSRIVRAMRARSGDSPTAMDQIAGRYPEVSFDQTLISPAIIGDLLFRGWLDKDALVEGLDSSSYFAASSEPAWRTALQVWRLADEKIEHACAVLEAEFKARKFDNPGEMFQVFGARLFLAEIGVVSKDKSSIQKECAKYIDDLKKTGRIRNKYEAQAKLNMFEGWGGYAFACSETPEFNEVRKLYEAVVDQVAAESLPLAAAELLKLMKKDPAKFNRTISINSVEQGIYADVALLDNIPVHDFASALSSLEPDSLRWIFAEFKARYDRIGASPDLSKELPWLEELHTTLMTESEGLRPLLGSASGTIASNIYCRT